MKKIYVSLIIALMATFGLHAQNLNLGDFEDGTTQGWSSWGEPEDISVVDNPDTTGINASSRVFKMEFAAAWKGVGKWNNDGHPTTASHKRLLVDVYVTDTLETKQLKLFLGNSIDGNPNFDQVKTIEVANEWVTLMFDISGLAAHDYRNIAFQNAQAGVYYIDNVVIVDFPDRETDAYGNVFLSFFDEDKIAPWFDEFNANIIEIADNPDTTGINTSDKVLKWTKGTEGGWSGSPVALHGAIDLSDYAYVSAQVYFADTAAVFFPQIFHSVDTTLTPPFQSANIIASPWSGLDMSYVKKWTEFRADISNYNDAAINLGTYMFINPNIGNAGINYLDNVKLIRKGLLFEVWDNVGYEGEAAYVGQQEKLEFDLGADAAYEGGPVDNFGMQWRGYVKSDSTGTYTFELLHSDGGRVWVNQKQIITNWQDGQNTTTGTIDLEGGIWNEIVVHIYAGIGTTSGSLSWEAPGIEKAIIPNSHLKPADVGVPVALSAPVVDGIITEDEVWNNLPALAIENPVDIADDYDAEEFEAYWKGFHFDNHIYLLVDVKDPFVRSPEGLGGRHTWDNVEIYLDLSNSKRQHMPRRNGVSWPPSYNPDDIQYVFYPTDTVKFGVNNYTNDALIAEKEKFRNAVTSWGHTLNADGYIFEIELSVDSLNKIEPSFAPADEYLMGFDINISDIRDTLETSMAGYRNQFTWFAPRTSVWGDPAIWGVVKFNADGTLSEHKDTEAPSIAGLEIAFEQLDRNDSLHAILKWNRATDNYVADIYNIFMGNDVVARVDYDTTYTMMVACQNNAIRFRIEAEDYYGNKSSRITVDATPPACTSSVDEMVAYKIAIYPVPSRDLLNIDLSSLYGSISMKIYDLTGKEVLSREGLTNSLQPIHHNLKAGFYFITVEADNVQITQKIVVQ